MNPFSLLLLGLVLTSQSYAIDLNLGFKTQYSITEQEIQKIAEMNGYEAAKREVTPDGQWLKCVSGQEGCQDIPLYQATYKSGEAKIKDSDEPWLGLDVTDEKQAEELALIMQKYVYEGWIKEVELKDKENSAVHFKHNRERTWCAIPWMNYIEGLDDAERKGRDLVHGLTKEFPIADSVAYPNIPFRPEIESIDRTTGAIQYREGTKDPDSFSSYGVAYFNRPNCDFFETIFGNEDEPKDPIEWLNRRKQVRGDEAQSSYETPDGSVSFKMLFTTLQSEESKDDSHAVYPSLKEAYQWVAHVSTHREKTPRIVQKVSHVQMDIAIKDSRLKNLMAAQGATHPDDVIPWAMLTYYFDPQYTNPIFDSRSKIRLSDEEIAKAPEGLKHMRPIGLQYGLDKGNSVIFYVDGLGLAANNHKLPPSETGSQPVPGQAFMDTRLNGPADNPESSCLGCHAASGYRKFVGKDNFKFPKDYERGADVGWVDPVFGVMDNATYNEQVKPAVNVDFNQQIRIGLQRYMQIIKGK